jgi:hypothetical protein
MSTSQETTNDTTQRTLQRTAAIALGIGTASALAFLPFHPVVNKGVGVQASLVAIAALQRADAIVHSVLVFAVSALAYGFAVLSRALGSDRGLVRLATQLYLLGYVAVVSAAIVDGFVVPGVATRYLAADPSTIIAVEAVLGACSIAIQVLTKLGLVAMSLAFCVWSFAITAREGKLSGTSLIGFVAGVVPVTFVLISAAPLVPLSLTAIIAVQSLWHLAAAKMLWSGIKTSAHSKSL